MAGRSGRSLAYQTLAADRDVALFSVPGYFHNRHNLLF